MNEFQAKVRKAALISAQIKILEEERKEILKSLGDLDYRQYPAGDYILDVQHNHGFNAALAKAALTPAQWKSIQTLKPDTAKAKALFPDLYRDMMKSYDVPFKYVIKEVTDD